MLNQLGCGVPQSDVEAARWLQKAADQGYARSQYLLGFAYQSGRGADVNNEEAFTWLLKSAKH
jgi:TPR repeat protein